MSVLVHNAPRMNNDFDHFVYISHFSHCTFWKLKLFSLNQICMSNSFSNLYLLARIAGPKSTIKMWFVWSFKYYSNKSFTWHSMNSFSYVRTCSFFVPSVRVHCSLLVIRFRFQQYFNDRHWSIDQLKRIPNFHRLKRKRLGFTFPLHRCTLLIKRCFFLFRLFAISVQRFNVQLTNKPLNLWCSFFAWTWFTLLLDAPGHLNSSNSITNERIWSDGVEAWLN